jgi:putative molybdopterin biosynthesis protein
MKRRIYLKSCSIEVARELLLGMVPVGGWRPPEEIPSWEACGRVTAEPVFARISSPPFHAAAMDGYALRAEDTFGAHVDNPVVLRKSTQAVAVNTGQPLPEGCNAVVMIEDVVHVGEDAIRIDAPVYPWQNVRKVGEDIVATQLLFPQNHLLSPYDVGALLGAGLSRVKVHPRPLVFIIPTGSELISPEELGDPSRLSKGRIIEFNSVVLSEMIRKWGGEPIRHPIVPDDPRCIREALEEALEQGADAVIINAGSSAGSEDHTANVIERAGELLVHGVSMMPGKPTVLGRVRERPVIGNPGYPVSAVVSMEQLVAPMIFRMLGQVKPSRPRIKAHTTRKIPSKMGIEEFVRVRVGEVKGRFVTVPLPRAAGSITTLTQADGILLVGADLEGIPEGTEVEVELLRTEEELRKGLVAIGSHDLALDLLADHLMATGRGYTLLSTNVGSLGGLMAIRKGHAHLAGTHLLDPSSGEYNIPYIQRYLRGVPVRLVHLVYREQGLMVAPGNPLKIKGVEDLLNPKVNFINRQAGSGTRVLLDYLLEQRGIDPSGIRGYEREEYTHMAVGVAVLSGAADAGMGILAAARALGLDFIPLVKERYDLVIPEEFFDSQGIQMMLDIMTSREYRQRIEAMGGYDASSSGEVLL